MWCQGPLRINHHKGVNLLGYMEWLLWYSCSARSMMLLVEPLRQVGCDSQSALRHVFSWGQQFEVTIKQVDYDLHSAIRAMLSTSPATQMVLSTCCWSSGWWSFHTACCCSSGLHWMAFLSGWLHLFSLALSRSFILLLLLLLLHSHPVGCWVGDLPSMIHLSLPMDALQWYPPCQRCPGTMPAGTCSPPGSFQPAIPDQNGWSAPSWLSSDWMQMCKCTAIVRTQAKGMAG